MQIDQIVPNATGPERYAVLFKVIVDIYEEKEFPDGVAKYAVSRQEDQKRKDVEQYMCKYD